MGAAAARCAACGSTKAGLRCRPAPPPKSAEASKPLDANGTLAMGSVHAAPLDLTNVKVTVATNDKVMHIFPLKAQIYGGQYSGDVTMDNRTATPALPFAGASPAMARSGNPS